MVMLVHTSYNEGLFNITIKTKRYSTTSNQNKKNLDPAPHPKHIIKDPRVRAIIVIVLLLLLKKQ
jgi:hypothetical protein